MSLFGDVRPLVHDARTAADGTRHLTAGDFHDERRRSSRALLDAVVVHAALVAHGALGDEAQVARGARGAARLEGRRLEQDVGGLLGDLGVEATHNARERHRAELGRGDDGHVRSQRALHLVERGELRAVGGLADHHMGAPVCAFQLVQVEGVQRLAEQEQDVVRHVDDVVDGALADGSKALDHPVGRRAHLHAADDAGGIARAAHGVLDGHVDVVGAVVDKLKLRGHLVKRVFPIAAIHRAHLAREPHNREAVGAVRRDLQVEHRVGQLQVVGDGCAHRGVVGEDPDTLMVRAEPQLTPRAAHAGARNAAQLRLLDLEVAGKHSPHGRDGKLDSRLDVRRAAHDLHGLARARVHRDHVHMVGIGMRLAGLDVAHDHAVERGAEHLDAFDACAREIELVAERLGVGRHLHVFVKPFQRYFHDSLFLECSLPQFELGGHTPCSNSPDSREQPTGLFGSCGTARGACPPSSRQDILRHSARTGAGSACRLRGACAGRARCTSGTPRARRRRRTQSRSIPPGRCPTW